MKRRIRIIFIAILFAVIFVMGCTPATNNGCNHDCDCNAQCHIYCECPPVACEECDEYPCVCDALAKQAAMEYERERINKMIAALSELDSRSELQAAVTAVDNAITAWNNNDENLKLAGIKEITLQQQRERIDTLPCDGCNEAPCVCTLQQAMQAERNRLNGLILQLINENTCVGLEEAVEYIDNAIYSWSQNPETLELTGVNTSVLEANRARIMQLILCECDHFYGADLPWLRVEGTRILDENDMPIMLEGVNAGGLLLTESWMSLMLNSSVEAQNIQEISPLFFEHHDYFRENPDSIVRIGDNIPAHNILLERFGERQTQKLWRHFRCNFWTMQDFENIAEMGMTVIRLPFMHLSVDPIFGQVPAIEGQRFNFTLLENFIDRAAAFGIYTILDLHGTYGSHNGQDHSGLTIQVEGGNSQQPGESAAAWDARLRSHVTFWDRDCPVGTRNREKTIELWVALAEHFYDNPNIAGFYLLNEPGEKARPTIMRHWQFFDEMYRAIRAVNTRHIIYFNPCWGGGDIPHPTNNPHGFRWDTNVVYAFHHYTHYNSDHHNYAGHMLSMRNRLNEVQNRNFGVPLMMGEFTALHGGERSWRSMLGEFQNRNWHWTSWTYKIRGNGVWGIYNLNASGAAHADLVDVRVDSVEEIMRKWTRHRTDHPQARRFRFTGANAVTPGGIDFFCLLQEIITTNRGW